MSGDLEVLLTWHDLNFTSGAVRGNYRVMPVVSIRIQPDAHEVEVRTHGSTKSGRVCTNTSGEDEQIEST